MLGSTLAVRRLEPLCALQFSELNSVSPDLRGFCQIELDIYLLAMREKINSACSMPRTLHSKAESCVINKILVSFHFKIPLLVDAGIGRLVW